MKRLDKTRQRKSESSSMGCCLYQVDYAVTTIFIDHPRLLRAHTSRDASLNSYGAATKNAGLKLT